MVLNGLNHIPPPSVKEFDDMFGGYLPSGTTIPSSWGVTRYYDFAPHSPPSTRRVILLHGGGTCAIGMAPLAFKLTDAGNHVVIYDLWGHGISSTPLETHTPALFHGQLLKLLADLGWTKCHLLGFSIGGSLAVSFTASYPKVVESLVIVAGAGLWRKSERGWWDALIMDGGWGLETLSQRKIINYVHGSDPRVKPGWKERLLKGEIETVPIQKWEREVHKGHVASLVSMFRYAGVYDQHEEYGKLVDSDVEVFVVLGDKDRVIEAESTKKELAKLGWKGEIRVIEGATHEIVRSHVKEVADLVGEVWGRLGK